MALPYTKQGPFNNDAPPAINSTRINNIDQGVYDLDQEKLNTTGGDARYRRRVNTIADLKALSGSDLTGNVVVSGYDHQVGAGGGEFYWDDNVYCNPKTVTVDTANNALTVTGSFNYETGEKVRFDTSFGGLTAGTAYYVQPYVVNDSTRSSTQFKVAPTYEDAKSKAGTMVTLNTNGATGQVKRMDNGGTVIEPNAAQFAGAWRRTATNAEKWNGAWFGVLTGQLTSVSTPRFNNAVRARGVRGGVLWFSTASYNLDAATIAKQPPNVIIEGEGSYNHAWFNHYGDAVLFDMRGNANELRGFGEQSSVGGWRHLTVGSAAPSANQKAIIDGEVSHSVIQDVSVSNYPMSRGVEMLGYLTIAGGTLGTESTKVENLTISGCLEALVFANRGGTDGGSFSDIRLKGLKINAPNDSARAVRKRIKLSGTCTSTGNATIVLDGGSYTVGITNGDTARVAAEKLMIAANYSPTLTGWYLLDGGGPSVLATATNLSTHTGTFSVTLPAGLTGSIVTEGACGIVQEGQTGVYAGTLEGKIQSSSGSTNFTAYETRGRGTGPVTQTDIRAESSWNEFNITCELSGTTPYLLRMADYDRVFGFGRIQSTYDAGTYLDIQPNSFYQVGYDAPSPDRGNASISLAYSRDDLPGQYVIQSFNSVIDQDRVVTLPSGSNTPGMVPGWKRIIRRGANATGLGRLLVKDASAVTIATLSQASSEVEVVWTRTGWSAQSRVSAETVDKRINHATDRFILGNQDWSDRVYNWSGAGTVAYSAADKGVIFNGNVTAAVIRAHMPVDPDSQYYLRAKVTRKNGSGTFYIGVYGLTGAYAAAGNTYIANNVSTTSVGTYYYEGVISGLASTIQFADIVVYANQTSGSGDTVIEWIELYKLPEIVHAGVDQTYASGTLAINSVLADHHRITLTANVSAMTILSLVNSTTTAQNRKELILEFIQDATGSRTIAFPSNVKLAGGAFTTSGANKRDTLRLIGDGTNWNEISRAMNVG